MADEINKKISIEVDIAKNGQQQLNQYKAAFDSLRSSVSNISSPLNNIADNFKTLNKNVNNIASSLDKLNKTAASFNSTGSKVGGILNGIIGAFSGLKNMINLTGTAFEAFEAEVTAGLSILITFIPVIVDWVRDLFSADTTTQSLNQTLKEHKAILDAVSQSKAQGSQDSQAELKHLDLLFTALTDHNIKGKEHLKIMQQLKSEYPDYFSNLSDETIKTGDAAKQYDNLRTAILAVATARAAEDMMTDNAKRQLKDEMHIDDLKQQINAKQAELGALKEKQKQASSFGNGRGPTVGERMQGNVDELTNQINTLNVELSHANTDFNILKQRNKQLEDAEIANAETNGSQILTGINHTALESTKTVLKASAKQKETFNKQKKDQSDALSQQLQQTEDYAQRVLQAQNELSELQIKGMKSGFAKQIAELTQQQKEREEQYDKTDKESATRIERLNNEMSAAKNANPNADTTQLQKMIDAEWSIIDLNNKKRIEDEKLTDAAIHDLKKQAYLQNDEDALNKADNSDAKYEAQRKLIIDSANFEIEQNKDNADKVKNIRIGLMGDLLKLDTDHQTGKNNEEEAKQKQIRKQRIEEAKKVAQQIGADGLKAVQDSIKQQADAKVAALEKDKAAELNNTALTSTQKAAIQQKYQQEEGKIKAKAFKEEQELNIAQAIINGAVAVTKVSAQDGVLAPLEIGVVVAETAAQVAKIASQKPPAYAAGGLHYASDGRGGMLPGYSRTDNTNAFLRSGEGIVVSEAMREPWARNLVSAINVGFGGRDFSTAATGRGFAVGGIFTDGGNANRYYNQPVNDNKNLANTIAYQMINNFPPVYVDVKDINNQQNILAQTINRVNL